jgi:hypothetical protein
MLTGVSKPTLVRGKAAGEVPAITHFLEQRRFTQSEFTDAFIIPFLT